MNAGYYYINSKLCQTPSVFTSHFKCVIASVRQVCDVCHLLVLKAVSLNMCHISNETMSVLTGGAR